MTLRLTPDLLAAAYDFLRATEPFKAWGLPESDDMGFGILKTPDYHGDCIREKNGSITIRISAGRNGHTASVLAAMSHEIIHARQFLLGQSQAHNAFFKRAAARVCKAHGFDPLTF